VLDTVLEAIDAEFACQPVERGGALLGPEGRELITHLLEDPGGRISATSYEASPELMRHVVDTEDAGSLRWKGIVHSHPGSFAGLSDPDMERLAEGLTNNPWLPWLHAPIVTHSEPGEAYAHTVRTAHGWLTWHTARFLRGGRMIIEDRSVVVLPIGSHLSNLARHLEGTWTLTVTDTGTGVTGVGGRVRLADGGEVIILASEHYPLIAPLVLLSYPGRDTVELPLSWSIGAGEGRLTEAVSRALTREAPTALGAFGPRNDLALTSDPGVAALAGWHPACGDPQSTRVHLREALTARTRGITSGGLGERVVLLAGCGSVGSYAAEQLARSGLGELVLLDPEPVEAANLSRTCYEVADIGRPKVEALGRRLLNIDPSLRVQTHACAIGKLSVADFDALVASADLVVAATDDPTAQLQIALHAQRHRRPALFIGLTAGARGGEVIITVPGETPCYRCATSIRHTRDAVAAYARAMDYGTARLRGVLALAVDIQHVTGVAVKLALSMLLRGDSEAEIGRFVPSILKGDMSFLTFSMSRDYWFYPRYFGTLGGQFGYQSVGMQVKQDDDCPICGEHPELDVSSGDRHLTSAAELRAALEAERGPLSAKEQP
jgi:proteasome lid subunit RPN8/RPN11